jgi:hypothetical protein
VSGPERTEPRTYRREILLWGRGQSTQGGGYTVIARPSSASRVPPPTRLGAGIDWRRGSLKVV